MSNQTYQFIIDTLSKGNCLFCPNMTKFTFTERKDRHYKVITKNCNSCNIIYNEYILLTNNVYSHVTMLIDKFEIGFDEDSIYINRKTKIPPFKVENWTIPYLKNKIKNYLLFT